MAHCPSNALPRLLYVADVPVESSYHGSALVYRLLQDYSAERLRVIESGPGFSLPERRLPQVRYLQLPMLEHHWLNTRFSRWAGSSLTFRSPMNVAALRRLCAEFRPDAILSVAHGYGWLAAARFAAAFGAPLHLMVHDDCRATNVGVRWLRPWQERLFANTYRSAVSRLCVSPYMEEQYRREYGVAGQVLYPSRARECSSYTSAPSTYAKRQGPLVGAYAGNIFSGAYAEQVRRLAERLQSIGGRVLLFCPDSCESLKSRGLALPNILPQGFIRSEDLIPRMRQEADFLFVPMAFDTAEERSVRLCFPSKLTDYTATGLPLFVWGPAYSSAVRWARQYGPLGEVVTSQSPQEIDAALERLGGRAHREVLGRTAAEVGKRLFAHHVAVDTLFGALLGSDMTPSSEVESSLVS